VLLSALINTEKKIIHVVLKFNSEKYIGTISGRVRLKYTKLENENYFDQETLYGFTLLGSDFVGVLKDVFILLKS